MRLIEELKRFELLSSFGARWWVYRNATPKFSFTSFALEVSALEVLVLITIRGDFSETMANSLMDFVEEIESSFDIAQPVVTYPRRTGLFTQVCAINPECHDALRSSKPELNARTLLVFPSYRCEFFGGESPDLVRLMRKDFVDTVNWKRSPSPKIRMRYENYTNGRGSIGEKLGLASFESLQSALENLRGCDGFVEIENYRQQPARIESSEAGFIVRSDNGETKKDMDELSQWARSFVF